MAIKIIEVKGKREKKKKKKEMNIQESRMALYVILMKPTVYIESKVTRRET